jgi:hypothetical protein
MDSKLWSLYSGLKLLLVIKFLEEHSKAFPFVTKKREESIQELVDLIECTNQYQV